MPAPLEDLNRDHICHFYQAPTGQRCGSPALKGEYYCYHHHLKHAKRSQRRVLIDPEVTCMEIPVVEDRATIFVALAAVVHRLAENTIDTRRAGQMIYGLQVALQALGPVPAPQNQPAANSPSPDSTPAVQPATRNSQVATDPQPATNNQQPAAPTHIPISKESLLYFLRSRHCASCNAELFPASELTERRNPGAPPEIIPEARPALPAPQPAPDSLQPATVLASLSAVASDLAPGASDLEPSPSNPATHHRRGPRPHSTFSARFALHSPRRSVSLRLACIARGVSVSPTGPHRFLKPKANRRTKWQQ